MMLKAAGIVLVIGAVALVVSLTVGGDPGPTIPIPVFTEAEARFGRTTAVTMADAIQLLDRARRAFANVKDYQCTYLRDEVLDGRMSKNHLLLKVRHEPFSVFMQWVSPKEGRRAAYVAGRNKGKMLVKEPVLGGLINPTIRLRPEASKERGESRHTIKEAGLKNTLDNFHIGWAREKRLGLTHVFLQAGDLKVSLPEREVIVPSHCVTTVHQEKDREHFEFVRVRFYFADDTGLPVRIEFYDWPAQPDAATGGSLGERYTYLDIETNVGLGDGDFSW